MNLQAGVPERVRHAGSFAVTRKELRLFMLVSRLMQRFPEIEDLNYYIMILLFRARYIVVFPGGKKIAIYRALNSRIIIRAPPKIRHPLCSRYARSSLTV